MNEPALIECASTEQRSTKIIQFGHNDQKKDAGISIQDFQRSGTLT